MFIEGRLFISEYLGVLGFSSFLPFIFTCDNNLFSTPTLNQHPFRCCIHGPEVIIGDVRNQHVRMVRKACSMRSRAR